MFNTVNYTLIKCKFIICQSTKQILISYSHNWKELVVKMDVVIVLCEIFLEVICDLIFDFVCLIGVENVLNRFWKDGANTLMKDKNTVKNLELVAQMVSSIMKEFVGITCCPVISICFILMGIASFAICSYFVKNTAAAFKSSHIQIQFNHVCFIEQYIKILKALQNQYIITFW